MRSILAIAFVLSALAFPGGAEAQSARVKSQPPCPAANCLEFDLRAPEDLTVRTMEKVSPVTGAAIVTFHGVLRCAPATRELSRLVHIQSQIVKLPDETPDGNGEGGHVIIGLLWNNFDGGPNYVANSFNLASTRVFKVKQGKPLRVAFRLARVLMSPDVNCAVEKSSAFTIHFVE